MVSQRVLVVDLYRKSTNSGLMLEIPYKCQGNSALNALKIQQLIDLIDEQYSGWHQLCHNNFALVYWQNKMKKRAEYMLINNLE